MNFIMNSEMGSGKLSWNWMRVMGCQRHIWMKLPGRRKSVAGKELVIGGERNAVYRGANHKAVRDEDTGGEHHREKQK